MNHYDPEDYLRADEEARFASLPRDAHVDSVAERRTVQVLCGMGLLHKRARLPWARRAATALFAAAFLFAAGVEYGKRAARGAAGDLSPVAEVQRAGSAYVAALMRLSETASPDSARLIAAGLEVGTSTLRAAALSAARMHPDNLSVLRIRDGLEIAADYSAAAPQRGGTFLVF